MGADEKRCRCHTLPPAECPTRQRNAKLAGLLNSHPEACVAKLSGGSCSGCGHRITAGDIIRPTRRRAASWEWLRLECCGDG